MFNLQIKTNIKIVIFLLAVYWITLFTATTLPGKDMPNIGVSDKISHFTGYFGLAVLLNIFLLIQNKKQKLKKNAWLFTLIIGSVYGAIDELHQKFIPGRSCDILDWLADVIGILLGITFVKIFMTFSKKSQIKS